MAASSTQPRAPQRAQHIHARATSTPLEGCTGRSGITTGSELGQGQKPCSQPSSQWSAALLAQVWAPFLTPRCCHPCCQHGGGAAPNARAKPRAHFHVLGGFGPVCWGLPSVPSKPLRRGTLLSLGNASDVCVPQQGAGQLSCSVIAEKLERPSLNSATEAAFDSLASGAQLGSASQPRR